VYLETVFVAVHDDIATPEVSRFGGYYGRLVSIMDNRSHTETIQGYPDRFPLLQQEADDLVIVVFPEKLFLQLFHTLFHGIHQRRDESCCFRCVVVEYVIRIHVLHHLGHLLYRGY
jgi:hypothetical protein